MNNDYQRARYVNPYTDFGFKKLFGTEMNKELLISFINSLFNGKEVVTDLTYLNTEHLGVRELDRKAVFDVYYPNRSKPLPDFRPGMLAGKNLVCKRMLKKKRMPENRKEISFFV